MNMNPNNKQCDIARVMTNSNVSNTVIKNELKKLTESEWNEQCVILDKILGKPGVPFDKGFPVMVNDFINFGAANGVDKATVFVAYMEWKNRNKK